mgnify:CR=1 FL=1|tara:strand:+ start:2646 stop:2897 length:252 start_codon:yes stop_codon:yes gene_type:complete
MKKIYSKICFVFTAALLLVGSAGTASAQALVGAPTDPNATLVNTALIAVGTDAVQLLLTGVGIGLVIFAVIYGVRKGKQGARS